jgi:hypothetical protein
MRTLVSGWLPVPSRPTQQGVMRKHLANPELPVPVGRQLDVGITFIVLQRGKNCAA